MISGTRKILFSIALILILLAGSAWAGQVLPALGGTTGGGTGALDAIYAGGDAPKYSALATGDICIVSDPSTRLTSFYMFYIDDDAQSESAPFVILPDEQSPGVAYSGNGAWLMMSFSQEQVSTPKKEDTAGELFLYEADGTGTDNIGLLGPSSMGDDTSYRGEFSGAGPVAAGAIQMWAASSSGTGAPDDPLVHLLSWIYLDDTGTNGDSGKLWSADKIYDELALKANLSSPTFTGTPAAPTAAADTNTTQIATTAFVIGQGYAKLASPTLTGTPAGPTAAADTNTTQLATTAFVLGQAYTSNPAGDGSASAGTSTRWARGDHVHPTDTSRLAVSLFDAHTVLYATTDNTPAALTVTEQTVVGRVTGGNISAISIDSDLSSVSANDDTVPSAKATKAYVEAVKDLDLNIWQGIAVDASAFIVDDTVCEANSTGIVGTEGTPRAYVSKVEYVSDNAGWFQFKVPMPDNWDGGSVIIELTCLSEQASPSGTVEFDMSVQARGNDDAANTTWVSTNGEVYFAGTSAIDTQWDIFTARNATAIAAGGSGGDMLFVRGVRDSADGTNDTSTQGGIWILGAKVYYQVDDMDEKD